MKHKPKRQSSDLEEHAIEIEVKPDETDQEIVSEATSPMKSAVPSDGGAEPELDLKSISNQNDDLKSKSKSKTSTPVEPDSPIVI